MSICLWLVQLRASGARDRCHRAVQHWQQRGSHSVLESCGDYDFDAWLWRRAWTALTEKERIDQKRQVRPIWWGLFHRHNAALIWDDNEAGNEFVNQRTGKLTVSAETFSDTFHELRTGVGKLMINSTRKHDGIAIHYSQASIQAHWLLDNLKYAREWMLKSGGDSDSVV